jgi:hypothetical protein
MRGRKWLAPTSGAYPIFVSGIAKTVFSVAMRKGAFTHSPTPPPTRKVSNLSMRTLGGRMRLTSYTIHHCHIWLRHGGQNVVKFKPRTGMNDKCFALLKMTHSFLKNSSAFGRVAEFSACFTTASAISLEGSEAEDAQLTDDVSSRTESLAFSCTYNNVAQFGMTPLLDNKT